MGEKIQLTPAVYWKLKALVLELEMGRQAIRARSSVGLSEAGLDPSKNYSLNDAEMTAEELQSPEQLFQPSITEDAKEAGPSDCSF